MSKSLMIGAIVAGVVLAAASCTQPNAAKTAARTAVQADAGHWVQSDRLQQIMMDLQTAAEQHWPASTSAPDASASEEARQEAFDEACALASALEESAGRIPDVARKAGLSGDELQDFLAEARTLQDEAERLERAGLRGDLDGMRESLDNIATTCDSCHGKFRDLAGPLDS